MRYLCHHPFVKAQKPVRVGQRPLLRTKTTVPTLISNGRGILNYSIHQRIRTTVTPQILPNRFSATGWKMQSQTEWGEIRSPTCEQGDVGMFGIIRASGHSAKFIPESFQSIDLNKITELPPVTDNSNRNQYLKVIYRHLANASL